MTCLRQNVDAGISDMSQTKRGRWYFRHVSDKTWTLVFPTCLRQNVDAGISDMSQTKRRRWYFRHVSDKTWTLVFPTCLRQNVDAGISDMSQTKRGRWYFRGGRFPNQNTRREVAVLSPVPRTLSLGYHQSALKSSTTKYKQKSTAENS